MDTKILEDVTYRQITIKRVDGRDLDIADACRLANAQMGEATLYENGGDWLLRDAECNNYDTYTVYFERVR